MLAGKVSSYRSASEALHREHAAVVAEQRGAHYRALWACGFAELIRADFYGLLELPAGACGNLLDAGCGTGFDSRTLKQKAPGLAVYGVDVSAVALADAVERSAGHELTFHQAALECLPFPDAAFDYIASHEVIEHAEDPLVVLREFARVLKPGGVCVLATPNGASWWIEHLRQRVMRLFGRRGAPVGEDHTRSPSFWRGQCIAAGFVVERQIFDGAGLEFQLFLAPAAWMRWLSRLLEPLRTVPGVNLVLCDRVKFRLRKPGQAAEGVLAVAPVCPACRAALAENEAGALCSNGHAFGRNAVGLLDFVSAPSGVAQGAHTAPEPPDHEHSPPGRAIWVRRLRRLVLRVFGIGYGGGLVLLLPLGALVGLVRQPFDGVRQA